MINGEPSSLINKNHVHRYLNYAASLLDNFHGNEPFHLYLKKYFSANKKHGSKDRKIIASLCYDYFRLGFGVSSDVDITQKFLLSTFLVEDKSSKFLEEFKPGWNQRIEEDIQEKVELVSGFFTVDNIFPFKNELSSEINFDKFSLSFLIQPKLFSRIRPGKEKIVLDKLTRANIVFEKPDKSCLSFSNNEKLSNTLLIDQEVVIQDYNSRKTLELLTSHIEHSTSSLSLWDCCAASGGKSILAYDLFKNIELAVSDTRKSILENLRLRFAKAGIKNYTSFMADLTLSKSVKEIEKPFDVIIADVPCSGSGTWSRTPEQLSFFNEKQIKKYTALQRKIVVSALPYLKEGGFFLYITCSVFKKENEENVSFIRQQKDLQLIKSKYLKGYEMQADTLFVALFKRNG